MAAGTCPRCGQRAIQKWRCLNCGYDIRTDDGVDLSNVFGFSCGELIVIVVVCGFAGFVLTNAQCNTTSTNALPSASASASAAPSAR